MNDTGINRETMGKLAKSLNFLLGPDNPTSAALKRASETGTDSDIKKARTAFLKLKSGDRMSALAMLGDD
jgi:hypothetical protein